ncbi:hypothetical protein NEOLEDRAFT_1096035 [Neolentinus lepideus HHB14362 ss-1]|uniref:SP-RING-type domain-containing protein n=1 Tax=Neolentinus lepideus HHB14362 ss-1 TaxID=1314782 RepID=A0A165R6X4_9AGAM|nr:hypothetical protein NEOLEDRAFT_1096035 [Neolentinus lepideus HHB14362 ss-1]
MPTAATSRRRARREPSEEPVAEGRQEEDEETQPRRSTKKKLSAKVKMDTDNEDEDEKEQITGRIDVRNFKDQPLDVDNGRKLGGLAADWASMAKTLNTSGFSIFKELGPSIAEVADGEESGKTLVDLDITMRDLIDLENEMLCYEKSLEDLQQLVLQGEEIDNVMERYDEQLALNVDAYKKKTSRYKYGKHKEYADFKQRIFEVQKPGQAMPPINDFIPREDGDDSDDDDEIEVGGMTQDYKCPLTLTILVNPLTAKACHHSFSAVAIREYLKAGPKTCPAAGCNQHISIKDLEEDKDLERRAKAAARREARREEDSDDEEVVE